MRFRIVLASLIAAAVAGAVWLSIPEEQPEAAEDVLTQWSTDLDDEQVADLQECLDGLSELSVDEVRALAIDRGTVVGIGREAGDYCFQTLFVDGP